MAVTIDPTQTVVFLDTSYFVFYRYYAVYNWYKLSKDPKNDSASQPAFDPRFLDKFDALFEKTITNLAKTHSAPMKNIVCVRDCSRGTIWRMALFPQYKKNRDDRLDSFDRNIFKHTYCVLLPKLMSKYGIQMYEHACAEADDIISVFVKRLTCDVRDAKIVVITNDNDYLQLLAPNVKVLNLKNLDLNSRLKGNTPQEYLEIKVLMGDKSDNIPSVFPKCGEKTAASLAKNNERLAAQLLKSQAYMDRYHLNKKLIDFNEIPVDIVTPVWQAISLLPDHINTGMT